MSLRPGNRDGDVTDNPEYEVYAVRHATRADRSSRETFLTNTTNAFDDAPVADAPEPIDYYYWVIRSADRVIVVDTGFTPQEAQRRNVMWNDTYHPEFLITPQDAARVLGFDPDKVSDVVLTHLHFDHIGNVNVYPSARFHIQRRELEHVVGPNMLHDFLKSAYGAGDINSIGTSDQRVRLRRDYGLMVFESVRRVVYGRICGFRAAVSAVWRSLGRLVLMPSASFAPGTGSQARIA